MRRALHIIAIASAAPAFAADFTAPIGCETVLTIQNRGCTASLVWRCEPEANGTLWEANFSAEGLSSIVSYDANYQWLDAAYTWDSSREEFAPPASDPISLENLLVTGVDTYDFTMRRATPDRSYDIRVTGADMLTGDKVTIDGFEMDEVKTRLEIIDDTGATEYASQGIQYFSRELGLFFLGPEQVFEEDGTANEYDDSPVDIILPGEPGFGGTKPLYDCDMQDAAFTPGAPISAQKETTDDAL